MRELPGGQCGRDEYERYRHPLPRGRRRHETAAVTVAVEGTTQLGYPASVIVPIGIVQVVCLLLYVLPRTAVLGAVLWTGYLGGAIATHVRIGNPLFTFVLFPVYVAGLLWGGLWLRDRRVRALLSPPVSA